MKPNIISIAGKSNAGKTTLLVKLIAELTERGHRVGTVKHAHDGFELDKKGKDSWRHKKAGAKATLVVTDSSVAMVKEDTRTAREKMEDYLGDLDLIIVEGFKRQPFPKIEIFRLQSEHKEPLCMGSPELIAFVTDSELKPDVPVFGLDDITDIAAFIEKNYLSSPKKEADLSLSRLS